MKKLNRIILLSIVLSLLLTMTANAAVFSDISNHWARSYIERVEKMDLFPDMKMVLSNRTTM